MNFNKTNKIKFLSMVLLIIGLAVAGYSYDFEIVRLLNRLQAISRTDPVRAAILFVAVFTVVKFTFLPMASASVLAGFLFGVFWGSVVAVVAITFSSALMFLLSRFLGRGYVRGSITERFDWIGKYDDKLRSHGFLMILFFRIVPVLPMVAMNFGFGLSRIRFIDFLLATAFGVLPGVILLVNAGQYITDWDNPRLYLFIGVYLLMIAVTFYLAVRIRRKYEKE